MIRSGNPALRGDVFSRAGAVGTETMTIQGTVNKSFFLLALIVLTASFVWRNPAAFARFMMPTMIGAFIAGLITVFSKTSAPFTAPLYAALEGLLLGTISSLFERSFPGIVIQAVVLTFGTLFALLAAYKSKLIKPTENFKLGVTAATGGIALVYIVSMVMGFWGRSIPLIHEGGIIGIGFSLFVVIIASLNLVMDFDFIEQGEAAGAPKYMEWYGAFGLMVTLIWLYLEILRLLSKTRRR